MKSVSKARAKARTTNSTGPKRKGPKKGQPHRPPMSSVPGLLDRMQRDHLAGLNWRELERKYGYLHGNIRDVFLRNRMTIVKRGNTGCFQITLKRLSEAELLALLRRQTRVCTPPEIKTEWREWPMAKRRWWIETLRARLCGPDDRPTTPFSANVEPFDYTTANARELIAAKNGGSSWLHGCKIKVGTYGVIWNAELWYWTPKTGYVQGVPWTKEHGRKMLNRAVWEHTHGVPVAPGCVVRHADGNRNNFAPANLVLATQNDVARENQAKHWLSKSREKTAALLNISTKKGTHELTRLLK